MRRKFAVALVLAVLSALTFGSAAMAHEEMNPCAAAATGPGHSGFAKHHIVPLVAEQHTHSPGVHRGFSGCVP